MNMRATTPVLKRFATKSTLVVFAVLFAVSAPVSMMQSVYADQWDVQIAQLQKKADEYQAQANSLRAKADTLQNKLNRIVAQIAELESKIKVNNLKKEKLETKIAENKEKLADAQDLLGTILASLYVDDNVSEVELLASSPNISEYFDKQEYRSSVRDQLNSIISDVKDIKAKLEKDKKAVDKILGDLNKQNKQMSAIRDEQQYLVNVTRGQEANYQRLVEKSRNQLQAVRAQQQAYYASLGGGAGAGVVGSFQYWGLSPGNGAGGCTGGYPWCMAQDTYVDPWNLYNRECVSYVAWALANRFGKNVQPWHGDGNAYEWVWSAPRWSGAWRVYSPKPGDVVVLPQSGGFAPIGHVMIVESVSGNDMFVSQYNFYGTGQYSTMWVKNSGVVLLRFPG